MTIVKLALITFGLLYVVALSGLFVYQRELQYFPARHDPTPKAVGLDGVERVILATPDGESLVLWFSPAAPGRPTILFLHGNAGAMADRADRLAFYQSRGFGAAFVSWRGYGGSSGRPSEPGLLVDAKTAYDHLRGRGVAASKIVLVGESLGAGVAVQIAARNEVGAVVLEAPFTAAVDLARKAYPWVPVGLLMRDKFRSSAHIAGIRAPVLILHGEKDAVIPFGFGQALYAAARDPKTFLSLGPVGHEALSNPATWSKGADFVDGAIPP
ncbi:MAG: alpha/beta hydrolase [Rhodobacter sp.]|nr:alpha/beta hydrolase [Rhodobacter sp.]